MSHNALPVASDVTDLLASLSTPIALPASFDVQSVLDAAITDWNERTLYQPFFQTSSTPVARTFDPPGPDSRGLGRGGGWKLLLGNGLLSLTSVYVGVDVANGIAGTLFTLGVDYWLYPAGAQSLSPKRPYTEIQFVSYRRGMPQSIVVTGVWGYCQTAVPDDAWLAICELAAGRCLRRWREGILAGGTKYQEGDESVEYDPRLLLKLGEGLGSSAADVLFRYRLLSY